MRRRRRFNAAPSLEDGVEGERKVVGADDVAEEPIQTRPCVLTVSMAQRAVVLKSETWRRKDKGRMVSPAKTLFLGFTHNERETRRSRVSALRVKPNLIAADISLPDETRRPGVLGTCAGVFGRGKLSWQGLQAPSAKARDWRVLEVKQTSSVSELCADLPTEFTEWTTYVYCISCARIIARPSTSAQVVQQAVQEAVSRQCLDWTIQEFQRPEGEEPPSSV